MQASGGSPGCRQAGGGTPAVQVMLCNTGGAGRTEAAAGTVAHGNENGGPRRRPSPRQVAGTQQAV